MSSAGVGSQAGDEQRLTVTCGNCYQETEVGMFTIGKDIYDFYKRHKTRIGRTFCSMDAICVRYNPLPAYAERLATEARIDEHSVIDGLGGFDTDKLPVLEQRVKELSATLTGKAE